jgi:DNA-binding beta-propeller fold protein YncE
MLGRMVGVRLTAAVLLIAAGVAAAALAGRDARAGATDVGDLTPIGCIGTVGIGPVGCGTSANLKDAEAVASSPDGRNLYVSSLLGAIETFRRAADGTLTEMGCFANSAPPNLVGPANCTPAPGIDAVNTLASTKDGKSLYAAANGTSSVAIFSRAPSGVLTSAGCIMQVNASSGCSQTAAHLSEVNAVVASPDGASVYAASEQDDSVQTFARAANGSLTPTACFTQSGTTGSDCTVVDGLSGPIAAVVSPDGKNVYIGGKTAIAIFKRSSGGALSYAGCVANPQTGPVSCTAKANIETVEGLAVSPDGSFLYAASSGNNVLETLSRAPDGSLTPAGCIQIVGSNQNCTVSSVGLGDPNSVAVSPDGKSLYVANSSSGDVIAFAREPNGTLAFSSCVANTGSTIQACATTAGLGLPVQVVVTPDGKNVYVTSDQPGDVAMFARATSATPPTTTTAPTTTTRPATPRPLVRLVSAQVERRKGTRRLEVRLRLTAQALVTIRLISHGGAALVTQVATLGAGAHTIAGPLAANAKSGSYRLTIDARGATGRHAALTATVAVPP